jgi:arsenate reductase (thioredoxin)
MAEPHVLFVCLHGAAKSVIAAMRFQHMAARRGLRIGATFAGTEPDAAIAPRVIKELLSEGIDLQAVRPRRVTSADVASASRIVTFGCDLEALRPRVPADRWDDVPAVSDDYATALEAIDARVALLVEELAGNPAGPPRAAR